MKNNKLVRGLAILYIVIMIFWNYMEYAIYSVLWDDLYIYSIWDAIKSNLTTIIIVAVISLIVNLVGDYINKKGYTRNICNEDMKRKIRFFYKWVNLCFNIILGYIVISAIVYILDIEKSNFSQFNLFLIYLKPILLWSMLQEILKRICKIFTTGIDENDKEQEIHIVEQEGVSKVIDDERESKLGMRIIGIIVLFLIIAYGIHDVSRYIDTVEINTQIKDSQSSEEEELQDKKKEQNYTIEQYISICTVVDTETIGRNPDLYIGKDILVEGSIGETFGVYSIGLWSTANPIKVEYEGLAYDLQLKPIGNILNGDYGFVAGEYIGDNTIRATVIVVYEDKYTDSYKQIISSSIQTEKNSQNIKEESTLEQNNTNTEEETAEWTAKIVASGEPGDLSIEYNAFSAKNIWYINFVFESSISTAKAKASYEINGSNGAVYIGEIDGTIQGGDVRTLEIPQYTFEEGEDVFITVFVNGEECSSTSVWITFY